MDRENMSKIILNRDEFTDGFKNSGRVPVFMSSPSILISSFNKKGFYSNIGKEVFDRITDRDAFKIIESAGFSPAETLSPVKEALEDFKNNAGSFSDIQRINIFAVGNEADFLNSGFDDFFNSLKGLWFGKTNIYIICIVDELDGKRAEEAVSALEILEKYTVESRVFVLGRQKLNGRVPHRETAAITHCKIIRNLILNINKINLPCGSYSAGYASVKDFIDSFWTETLGRCIPEENNRAVSDSLNEILEKINLCISEKYENRFSAADLRNVIKNNVTVSFDEGRIEESVRLLYGDSLEVYVENERKKIDKRIEEIPGDVKKIIFSADEKTEARLKRALEERLEVLDDSKEDIAVDIDLFDDNRFEIEKTVYEKYLFRKIADLKQYFIKKALNKALTVISEDLLKYTEMAVKVEEAKKSLNAYVTNHMKTSSAIGGSLPDLTVSVPGGDYINGLCREFNTKLSEGKCFERFIQEERDAAAAWLYTEAEPYCINNAYNIHKAYYFTGSSQMVKIIENSDFSFTVLGNSYDKFDALFNCTSINLPEYRKYIMR